MHRRVVISFLVTVSSYDYGCFWYFYLDGRMALECKATGIVFTSDRPEGENDYATELAPALARRCTSICFRRGWIWRWMAGR
jgi:primary-amine oxidase